jgi:subfamily B ATP-binding cassette protein MsbA
MEGYETERAEAAIDDLCRLNIKAAKARNALHPIMELLGGLAIVAVILYGGNQVIEGAKAPGSFFAFIFALLLAYEPVKRLGRLNAVLQEGLAAAERVFALLDMEPQILERPGAHDLTVAGGEIRAEGVAFAYGTASSDTGAPALHGIDLRVPAGATVALVGPSGAGKSTLLNLIPRFYDPAAGRITIDGQDIREVSFASLRGALALVSQEILLFDDTLGANIAYGRPGAARDEIEAAARHAGAHDFISALPEGYDTPVGPRGVKLSGGQRQRIAIARVILKDAPILVLDEATSALDSEVEAAIQDSLNGLMAGKTVIAIAHRLSTIAAMDRLIVMDQGRIVEEGTHGALLESGGLYAGLWARQSGGFLAEDAAE